MSEDTALPERAARPFERHDAFERNGEWFEVTTTRFDGRASAEPAAGRAIAYTVEVRAPMLSAAVEGSVGPAVEDGWFETYERRLEDAPMAVRGELSLSEQRVVEETGDAVAVFGFELENADRAPDVIKAIAEYVEGTYVEGVVPGYDYVPPVSSLLSRAMRTGGGGRDERDTSP
ncbi:DUF5813 family protein [Natronomonas sp.]|uniref:DUF5813 family protein n=1 Tax=Natronomonas sp. TaxID=2184060 RepID=UPI0026168AD4|nr:DUF5813 family protein [Natronomonas sp.]